MNSKVERYQYEDVDSAHQKARLRLYKSLINDAELIEAELIREKQKKKKRERDIAERVIYRSKSFAEREGTKAVKFNIKKSGDKLKFTLQDNRDFRLDTTYRKRDKYSDQPGVSLFVGNKESTGGEEVIAILFDDDRFDEETAAEWWDRNEIRFRWVGGRR